MDARCSPIPWRRFVAVGDSLTEGVGDPYAGSLRGWADRLAQTLKEFDPQVRYWNLAVRSLTTRQIRDAQLERAVELKPDLVSVLVGMNDVMAPTFAPETFRVDLLSLIEPLRGTGATLLIGTLPRDLPLLRVMPRRRAHTIRRRLNQVSDAILTVAAEHAIACMDAPRGWRYTMAECSVDGCHPNARGHAHIAELALEALAEQAAIELPAVKYSDCSWLPSSVRHVRWLAARGFLSLRLGSIGHGRKPK